MRKIVIEVSEENEHTASPWWLIINPRQVLELGDYGIHNIANMITGPFFSREEAQNHLDARRYAFGKYAKVYCHSGYYSPQYHKQLNF